MSDFDQPMPIPGSEWPESLEHVLDDMGRRPINVHGLMAHHPQLLSAWWDFRNHTVNGGALTNRDRELIILIVARHIRNNYEWQSHIDRAIAAGLTGAEIEAIWKRAGDWNERDKLLIRAVGKLLTDSSIPEDLQRQLSRYFTTQQVMDIIFIHGAYVVLGCLLNTFEIPVDDEVTERLRHAGLPSHVLIVNER